MTDLWKERAIETLKQHSVPAGSLQEYIDQWVFTGEIYDFKKDDAHEDEISYPPCELCGYEHIRWGFVISNRYNKKSLIIGSVCIYRFKLAERSLLQHLINEKLRCDRFKRITSALEQLDEESFLKYYLEHGAFTPSQAAYVFQLMNRNGIFFSKADFKIKIRRDREKAQLVDCWQDISECFTPQQWKIVNKELKRNHSGPRWK